MNRKLLAMLLASTTLALGACGDDDGGDTGAPSEATTTNETPPPEEVQSGGGGGGDETQLRADAEPSGELKFTTEALEGKAGTITVTMANPSDLPHAVGIKGAGVDEQGETVDKGGTSTVTAELKAGEYEFYCPVPGHEEGGMKGTLSIK